MIHIRRIAVIATATTVAIVGAIVVAAMMLLMILSTMFGGGAMMFMSIGGVLALIVAPILYAVFAWLVTALICVAYNAAASFTGGIGFRVERDGAPEPVTPAPIARADDPMSQ